MDEQDCLRQGVGLHRLRQCRRRRPRSGTAAAHNPWQLLNVWAVGAGGHNLGVGVICMLRRVKCTLASLAARTFLIQSVFPVTQRDCQHIDFAVGGHDALVWHAGFATMVSDGSRQVRCDWC